MPADEWCKCTYKNTFHLENTDKYDARCRPWYKAAMLEKNENKVLLSDPYLYQNVMYTGFANYVPLTSTNKDSIIREDINYAWHLYNDTIFDEILDHYFLVNVKGNVIKHS